MTRLRELLLLDDPQETQFFGLVTAFALVVGVAYWVLTREEVGTVLLLGFALAAGVVTTKLHLDPRARLARERARAARREGDRPRRAADRSSEGEGGIDRPFLDESGRLPAETLAPLALGAGVSLVILATIFGPAPAIVGILPLAWGAWQWLHSASAEYEAVEHGPGSEPEAGVRQAAEAKLATATRHGTLPDDARDRASASAISTDPPDPADLPGPPDPPDPPADRRMAASGALAPTVVDDRHGPDPSAPSDDPRRDTPAPEPRPEPRAPPAPGPQHVVIIGGGFGGLYAARTISDDGTRVTLIDRRNFHLFQPLLYQVATGALAPNDIASPLRSVLERRHHVTVLLGDVVGVDPGRRCIELADGATIDYDVLVIATGSITDYHGHEDWGPIAPGLKTVEEAEEIRRRVLLAFENAEREQDRTRLARWLTFVVVGGGTTGVELAGAIGEVANRAFRRRFRRIDPTRTRIVLVNSGDRLIPEFPARLSRDAAADLRRLGVEIISRSRVVDVDPDGVMIRHKDSGEEQRVAAASIVWAAGVRASPVSGAVAAALDAPIDHSGRVAVRPDLTIPGHPDVFVIGDAAAVDDGRGAHLPGVAPVAIQEGQYVASALAARRTGRRVRPFRYRDRGSLATVGTGKAVAKLGPLAFDGIAAWFIWLFVHLLYLVEFQNRVLVFIQWAWSFFTRGRSSLLITGRSFSPAPGAPGRRA